MREIRIGASYLSSFAEDGLVHVTMRDYEAPGGGLVLRSALTPDAARSFAREIIRAAGEQQSECACCGSDTILHATPLGPLCSDCATREVEAPKYDRGADDFYRGKNFDAAQLRARREP